MGLSETFPLMRCFVAFEATSLSFSQQFTVGGDADGLKSHALHCLAHFELVQRVQQSAAEGTAVRKMLPVPNWVAFENPDVAQAKGACEFLMRIASAPISSMLDQIIIILS